MPRKRAAEESVGELDDRNKENKTMTCRKLIGAHISAAGGVNNVFKNAAAIGADGIAFFLTNQRTWKRKPLDQSTIDKFKQEQVNHRVDSQQLLPHGSYLMNLGSPKPEILAKSRDAFVDELKRCDILGIPTYNFHPGSSLGVTSPEECCSIVAESINLAHSQTERVVTVVENMCGQGHTVGGRFEQLRDIIRQVQDKSRVGVCIDTCHLFAAGYDFRDQQSYTETMTRFGDIVGFKYLKGIHLNDSKGGLGSHLDRHENIGQGKIGMEAFRLIVNDDRMHNIPMILETPFVSDSTYEEEIKLLKSLIQ